jgi:glycine cleavage system aminomethyltransferase T
VTLTFDDPAAFPWGGEPLHVQGEPVGEITSAGCSWKLGRAIAMAYVPARALPHVAVAGACAVELNGAMTPVTVRA